MQSPTDSPKEQTKMNVDELRQRYLEFFKSKNHLIYPVRPPGPQRPHAAFHLSRDGAVQALLPGRNP